MSRFSNSPIRAMTQRRACICISIKRPGPRETIELTELTPFIDPETAAPVIIMTLVQSNSSVSFKHNDETDSFPDLQE